MKIRSVSLRVAFIALAAPTLVIWLAAATRAAESDHGLAQGSLLQLSGNQKATITSIHALPFVDSQYSRLFKFDTYDNPKLKQLREQYHLDEVVAPGKDEFERQILLLDWVNHRFKKFGKPSSDARGALKILQAIDEGNSFFCSHYGDVFVSAAASMGWVDRILALRRPDNIGSGSTEHTSTEIWSNQYGKWIMFDPTFAMTIEKDGVPLSAYEFRQEWFYHGGQDLVFVLDKERKRYRKSDLPVFRNRYPGFGDLVLDGGALNVYAFIGYVPNTNIMDAGLNYGQMFITKDNVCDGTQWHKRMAPANPATDPYFPIDQAALTLTPNGQASVKVTLKTMTPNFRTYVAQIDGEQWKPVGDSFAWSLHSGRNQLLTKSVNQFGVDGPVSTAEIVVK